MRQANPHWHAYFLITDEKPFEEELTQILGGFHDPRLHFLDIPMEYRPPVSSAVIRICPDVVCRVFAGLCLLS